MMYNILLHYAPIRREVQLLIHQQPRIAGPVTTVSPFPLILQLAAGGVIANRCANFVTTKRVRFLFAN